MRSEFIDCTATRGWRTHEAAKEKLASRARVPLPAPTRPNERWSIDFVSARTVDGRGFRTLTVLDIYTRESLALLADRFCLLGTGELSFSVSWKAALGYLISSRR